MALNVLEQKVEQNNAQTHIVLSSFLAFVSLFSDLFSRVLFFFPFCTLCFCPSKSALFCRARGHSAQLGEGEFQDGPLHKEREGNPFPKSALKRSVNVRIGPSPKSPLSGTSDLGFGDGSGRGRPTEKGENPFSAGSRER